MKLEINSVVKSTCLLLAMLLGVQADAQYCTPTYSVKCGSYNMYIDDFKTTGGVTNISNINSGCGNTSTSYTYYSTKVHTGVQGTPVGFTIQNGPSYPRGFKIWVDFNRDGDFSDAGERVYSPSSVMSANATTSGTFTIPPDAKPGESRLRIRCSYYTTSFNECNNQSYGECEDYKFVILPSCSADFPDQPKDIKVCEAEASNFTATTTNANAYQWQANPGTGWVDIGDDAVYGGTTTKNLLLKSPTLGMQGYQYRLVATNTSENCSVESDPATLTLVPTTQSSVVLAAAPSTDICLNEEAILYTSYTNGGNTPQYKWLLNGLEIPGETNATLKIKSLDHGDIIQCRFFSSNKCVPPNNSLGVKFSVVSNLKAEVGVSVSYNGNNSYTFIADPVNGGVDPKYVWYKNGKLIPNENGQSFTSETLAPWDNIEVGMLTSRDCAMPKLAMSRLATTGVSTINSNIGTITVAPNPNKGIFSVQSENTGANEVSIYITNAIGQVIYNSAINTPQGLLQHDINIEGQPAGIYIMHIEAEGRHETAKFSVAR
mgnify:CR=1 FL=1